MKLYDLLHKYGWEIIPVLSSLGVQLLADANFYFVDSGATNAQNANDGEHGNSWDRPFATANYAVSRCTASQGDIVLLAPGHAETIQDTGTASGTTTDEFCIDKAGITILGLGRGSLRPTFTLSGATDAAITILAGATNVTIKNLLIVSDLADVAAGITISATSDGALIEDCEFRDGSAVKELIIGISLAAAADDVTIKNCRFYTTDAGSSTASAIKLVGAAARCEIVNNVFRGDWNTATIDGVTAAGTDILIADNVINQLDAAAGLTISLHASTTGAVVRNLIHGGLDTVHPVCAGCLVAENYSSNAEGASGVIQPAVDS